MQQESPETMTTPAELDGAATPENSPPSESESTIIDLDAGYDGKVLKYDPAIYGQETFSPQDLEKLHARANAERDGDVVRALDKIQQSALDQVPVSVSISDRIPIHASAFPGEKEMTLSIPMVLSLNGKDEHFCLTPKLGINETLYLLDQINGYVRNFVLRYRP